MPASKCFHCGEACQDSTITSQDKVFCCHGCLTVYQILSSNGMLNYYELESHAGNTPLKAQHRFDFLDNEEIVREILEFDEGGIQVLETEIPGIHCSSCIWVLENLHRIDHNIVGSQVDFPKKRVRITYQSDSLSAKKLCETLHKIGYAPHIDLEDKKGGNLKPSRRLIYQLGLAGFAFGNVMLLSFPEYFEVSGYWLDRYKLIFRWLMFAFSIPVVLYSASDYFTSAYKGIKAGILNIDVPISLGIMALFTRSTVDISLDLGSGFFDCLTGLVFFLLLGRYFQKKTYEHLSFERDYRSYMPISVTRLSGTNEEQIKLDKVRPNDRILIRHAEIIPADATLISESAQIDYSYVTGEAVLVPKKKGDLIYAGGRQTGGAIELLVKTSVSESNLVKLWANHAFSKTGDSKIQTITNLVGQRFTWAVLTIAFSALGVWLYLDSSMALHVFTSVLIIACPCALALAAPFTLGSMTRIFGKLGFFLKDASVIERMASINTVVFDKTGTLTSNQGNGISYDGMQLSLAEQQLMKSTLRASNHPLSMELYNYLNDIGIQTLDDFESHEGLGIKGYSGPNKVTLGSPKFVGTAQSEKPETAVHISSNDSYKGKFVFKSKYRQGIPVLFKKLLENYDLMILSGDNSGERSTLNKLIPFNIPMFFDQKPMDKLNFIKKTQDHSKVMMIGDGLNDAGALAQADLGVAVVEDINSFSPASDGIIKASEVVHLNFFMRQAKNAMSIIRLGFILSLAYNVVGLYFALTGQLKPVIAAILMPLSSISIVVFTTLATRWVSRKKN